MQDACFPARARQRRRRPMTAIDCAGAPLSEDALTRLGRATIAGIPDAVIYADRDGRIRFWNDGAARIFGFAAEEALGRSLDIIIPERLRARHWAGWQPMMETGRSRYGADALLSVPAQTDRKGGVWGKRVAGRGELGVSRFMKKKTIIT